MPYVTVQSDWQDLANKAFKTINGDRGGTWAPSTLINIGGSGMQMSTSAEVNYGGTLKTLGGSRYTLGVGEWPSLSATHVGRSRVLRTPVHARMASPRYYFADSPTYPGSIQSMACTLVSTSGLEQPGCFIPLRVHNGARLASGVVKFRISPARTQAPKAMPRLRIIRVDADGKIESLRAESTTVDSDGYSYLTRVTSGDAWYAAGASQSWAFTCDQLNTIDTSLFTYFLQLIEETGTIDPSTPSTAADGTLVRERKADVVYVFQTTTPISGDPNPVPNGPTIVTGDRCLVVAGTGATEVSNGIFIANMAGAWARAADLSVPSDFTLSFVVYDKNQGSMWECTKPIYGQSMKLGESAAAPGYTLIAFQRRKPRGNIYHSIVCTFDQISDMRPQ